MVLLLIKETKTKLEKLVEGTQQWKQKLEKEFNEKLEKKEKEVKELKDLLKKAVEQVKEQQLAKQKLISLLQQQNSSSTETNNGTFSTISPSRRSFDDLSDSPFPAKSLTTSNRSTDVSSLLLNFTNQFIPSSISLINSYYTLFYPISLINPND